MNKFQSFVSNTQFYAQEHFPYSLSRSGEFTKEQVELLENHGKAYQAIHSGDREPVNDEEHDFLAVCRGEREPITAHEKAWVRFCEKSSKGLAVSAFGAIRTSITDVDHTCDSNG